MHPRCVPSSYTLAWSAAGLRPLLHRLDNECSAALKTFLRDSDIDFQLVPPRTCIVAMRPNVQSARSKIISSQALCSVDKDFPLHLWDKLLPQASSRSICSAAPASTQSCPPTPKIHGQFDFNRTPLAPPGIRVLAHIKPSERTTWSPTAPMDGTLVPLWNPIGVTPFGCGTHERHASATRSNGSRPKPPCP